MEKTKGPEIAKEKSLLMLNGMFCPLQLYGEFADVFDLSESKLAIIHCAGHYDPTLVESMWKDIIEKGTKPFPVCPFRNSPQVFSLFSPFGKEMFLWKLHSHVLPLNWLTQKMCFSCHDFALSMSLCASIAQE